MSEFLHLLTDRIATPIGELLIVADCAGNLRATGWIESDEELRRLLRIHNKKIELRIEPEKNPHGLIDAICSYFAGDFSAIDNLPVQAAGTPFQEKVWRALRQIPCGTTISYGTLAGRIGHPSAVRAVGLANGANPVAIVVPCHRVIGSDGSLTGYGGGMHRKRWLLDHERAGSKGS